jgi:hypothetical protein
MKKNYFLLSTFALLFALQVNSQNCTPDHTGYTSVPAEGIMLPATFPSATQSSPYQQTITVGVPSSAQGQQVNWIKFLRVESSLNNTWTVVNNEGGTTFPQWNKSTWQCVTFSGTPENAGTDVLTVFVDANVNLGILGNQTLTNQNGGTIELEISPASTTGIETNKISTYSVYPNPTSDVVIIEATQLRSAKVIDLQGRILREIIAGADRIELNLSDLNKGLYIVMIQTETEGFSTKVKIQ